MSVTTTYRIYKWSPVTQIYSVAINTTGVTSGAGTAYPSGAHEFTPGVTRSSVLCVCFVDRYLSFFLLAIVLSSIYGF